MCLSSVTQHTFHIHLFQINIAISTNKRHHHKIHDAYSTTATAEAQTRPITSDGLVLVCLVPPWMSERCPDGNLLLISCQLTSDDEAIILQWR